MELVLAVFSDVLMFLLFAQLLCCVLRAWRVSFCVVCRV